MAFHRYRRTWRKYVWYWVRRAIRPTTVIPVEGQKVCVDLKDRYLARMLYTDAMYEPEVKNLFQALDLSGGVCVDIGANVGVHTLTLSRMVGPSGRVHAFEPEAHNLELLDRNLELNRIENVVVHRCALGDAPGRIRLTVNSSNHGDHRVAAGNSNHEARSVEIATADERLASIPPGSIRLIKIDVQGYECRVLRGMSRTLATNPGALLFVEVDPGLLSGAGDSARQLVGMLRDMGYGGWEFDPYRLIPLLDPWAYEMFREGRFTNLLLARDPAGLRDALTRMFGPKYMQPVP